MNSKIKPPEKPLCLRKKDAENAIGVAINSAAAANGLTYSDLESILYRYYIEAQHGAEKERYNADIVFQRQMKEYMKLKEETGGEANGGDHCESNT